MLGAALATGAVARAVELTLCFTPRWKQQTVQVPVEVVNQAGQRLRVTRFAALISGVVLHRSDGGVVRLDGQYGFIDASAARLEFPLRSVPEGDYAGVEFEFGLPPEVNHADPGKWATEHSLNPLVNRLHWSWQGGYVFVALEGRWRDAADGSLPAATDDGAGTDDERGFSYHLATDARRVPVRIQMAFRVEGATRLEFAVELSRVLGGHRIVAAEANESTHSGDGDEWAAQLAEAMQRAVFGLGAVSGREVEECGTSSAVVGGALCPDECASSGESGRKAPPTPAQPYAFVVPPGFPQPNLPADNPLTVEGVALGEALFSDVRLAGNGAQSCASCHAPERAFSDTVALSRGADGKLGKRNATALFNLAWNPSFAWDGAQARVRDQAHAAWINPDEMHAEPARVVAELSRDAALAEKFRTAFGSHEITPERVTQALEQYLLTLVSADAKFDRARRGLEHLTVEEQHGFELFATEFDPARGRRGADCFHCHGGILFSDYDFKNNGLDRRPTDGGRAAVTGQESDRGKFKTPSLRNVALTAPYMHDGRFATLEEVVAHYDHGVRRSRALDPNIAKHPASGLELSVADQRALVAFLRTLTDRRWSELPAVSRLQEH